MGRPKKITTSQNIAESQEVLPNEKVEEVVNAPVKETKVEEKVEEKVEDKGVLCKVCSSPETPRYHVNSFDEAGIGHWPFSPETKAARQFEFFCKEPKVSLFIPMISGEKRGALATPQVNSLKIGIRKGQYVNVPKALADIIMESLNQTARAETETRLAPNPFTGERRMARIDQQDTVSQQILNQ